MQPLETQIETPLNRLLTIFCFIDDDDSDGCITESFTLSHELHLRCLNIFLNYCDRYSLLERIEKLGTSNLLSNAEDDSDYSVILIYNFLVVKED